MNHYPIILQPPPSAPEAKAAPEAGAPDPWMQMLPIFGVAIMVYFLIIRPGQKQNRQRQSLLKSLTKGMVVRTHGIRGEITAIDEREVTLMIADRVKINVLRSAIDAVETPADSTPGAGNKGKSSPNTSSQGTGGKVLGGRDRAAASSKAAHGSKSAKETGDASAKAG